MAQILPKSLKKELIKFQSRQGRRKSEFYLVEGERCCSEALKWCKRIRYGVFCESRNIDESVYDFPIYALPDKEFDLYSMTENTQGVFYVVERPQFVAPEMKDPFLLVLDGLQEPGNVGTILRTALAVGLQEVVLIKGTVDPFNPKAVRSGMGAQFKLSFSIYDNMAELASAEEFQGRRIWLTTPHDGVSCYSKEFELQNSLLVFGEEGGGVSDFSIGEKTAIPMPGPAESLNVAQAATIYMFEGVRRGLLA